MTDIYNKVTEAGLLNYHGARMQLPFNIHFPAWEALAGVPEETTLILKYGFPVEYDGPVLTPDNHNHASVLQHSRDVATYVLTELEEGAMLGPFDMEPFIPWCQVNTLLTRQKRRTAIYGGS